MGQGRANPTAVRIGQRTLAGLNRQRNRAGGILTRVARARNQRRRARPRAAVR